MHQDLKERKKKKDIAQADKMITSKHVEPKKALCVGEICKHILVVGVVKMEHQPGEVGKDWVMKDPVTSSRTLRTQELTLYLNIHVEAQVVTIQR